MPRESGGQLVEREFLTLGVWDRLDAQTAGTVARAVERCLPEPWNFARVAWHECGGQARHVAFFDWSGNEFALVPGAEVTLGHDPARPTGVSAGLVEEWEKQAHRNAGWEDITWGAYLADVLTPLRTVTLGPFLISTAGKGKPGGTGAAFRRQVRQWGLRLPTGDEWEYACSAGSRSLWHWGDDPVGGAEVNAFGLVIVRNTYDQEALDQPGDYRGGDGGVREHGGAHELECMVPLSSWFHSAAAPSQEDWWEYTKYRPVFPLPSEMLG